MKTHFVTLTLRATHQSQIRPAGMFLADPIRGVMDNTSRIPLSIFEQIEESLRDGHSNGKVKLGDLSGTWQISRLSTLEEMARWHGQTLASATQFPLAYKSFLGRDVGLLIDGEIGSFRVPIEDARHLIATHAVTGEPSILDPYAEPESSLLKGGRFGVMALQHDRG